MTLYKQIECTFLKPEMKCLWRNIIQNNQGRTVKRRKQNRLCILSHKLCPKTRDLNIILSAWTLRFKLHLNRIGNKVNLIQFNCHTTVLYLSIIWIMYETLFNNLLRRIFPTFCSTISWKFSHINNILHMLCHAKLNPLEQNQSTGGLWMCVVSAESFWWFPSFFDTSTAIIDAFS